MLRVRESKAATSVPFSAVGRTETDCRFEMEVVTASGRAAPVRFQTRPNTVEVWLRDRRCAVLNRKVLRAWLAEPDAQLAVDEVTFSLDRMVDTLGRVAVSLPGVLAWTLAPTALAELRKRV